MKTWGVMARKGDTFEYVLRMQQGAVRGPGRGEDAASPENAGGILIPHFALTV
jgi:hypothetical protein